MYRPKNSKKKKKKDTDRTKRNEQQNQSLPIKFLTNEQISAVRNQEVTFFGSDLEVGDLRDAAADFGEVIAGGEGIPAELPAPFWDRKPRRKTREIRRETSGGV